MCTQQSLDTGVLAETKGKTSYKYWIRRSSSGHLFFAKKKGGGTTLFSPHADLLDEDAPFGTPVASPFLSPYWLSRPPPPPPFPLPPSPYITQKLLCSKFCQFFPRVKIFSDFGRHLWFGDNFFSFFLRAIFFLQDPYHQPTPFSLGTRDHSSEEREKETGAREVGARKLRDSRPSSSSPLAFCRSEQGFPQYFHLKNKLVFKWKQQTSKTEIDELPFFTLHFIWWIFVQPPLLPNAKVGRGGGGGGGGGGTARVGDDVCWVTEKEEKEEAS